MFRISFSTFKLQFSMFKVLKKTKQSYGAKVYACITNRKGRSNATLGKIQDCIEKNLLSKCNL